MYKLEVTTKITQELLLSKYSQEQYMEFYLELPVKKGLFTSPLWLRKDKNPTCSFYKDKRGNLMFNDFAGIKGNFITIVMAKYDCSYYKALRIIGNDFGFIDLNTPKNIPVAPFSGTEFKETVRAKIQVEIQEFSKKELTWWQSFGISGKTLKRFKVFSIKSVFLNDQYFTSSTDSSPIYGYYGGKNSNNEELWRLYMPTKTKYRFLTNTPTSFLQGAKQLVSDGNHCFIIKSMKDLMLLSEFEFIAIAPTSENILLSESQFKKVSAKFSKVICWFDNDLAGVKGAHKYKKAYDCRCIFLKRKYAKDATDLYKKISATSFWEVVNELNSIITDKSLKKTKHFYIF